MLTSGMEDGDAQSPNNPWYIRDHGPVERYYRANLNSVDLRAHQRQLGLRTVSLTDTAVQSTGVDGGGSTSVRPFGSTEQHQTETGGCKTAVNGCRRPSIVLTLTKMIIIISILEI